VFAAISNTIPFFQRAHVVVNLSHPDKWIETFGLTLLEAMACGRPVIAPNIGGPTELVTHGTEGYCVDGRSPELVASAIKSLRTDFRNYVRLSENARRQAANFSPDRFEAGIQEVFSLLPAPAAEPKSGNSFRKLEFSGRL
jgi:glycosyltransferase involved in cell wall biosynthesis